MGGYFWIAVGGALGSMARQGCSDLARWLWPIEFPWGTLVINVLGSTVIGAFAALTDADGRFPLPVTARQFVMVGICGGYTTFSSFSLQTLTLMRDGKAAEAALNIVLSVALCLVGVALGQGLAGRL